MKRLSHSKRRDANEPEIVQALEAAGCTVIRLDPFDLLVGRAGVTLMLEVKTPDAGEKKRDKDPRTDAQKLIDATWRGSPLRYVTTREEALAAVNEATRTAG